MLSDIVNKSSVSLFVITKIVKEEFRERCCLRQNHYIHELQ